jgi:hypothetical protein
VIDDDALLLLFLVVVGLVVVFQQLDEYLCHNPIQKTKQQ